MVEPFLAEIRIFGFGYAPQGWALCNGQLLPIDEHEALFSLLGATYGGDGETTFALPNLQGRAPMHDGNGHTLGESGGEAGHILITSEMPAHTHQLQASTTTATAANPAGNVLAGADMYDSLSSAVTMHSASVATTGSSQPHENMQPYLTLNFCIALQGIFPSST